MTEPQLNAIACPRFLISYRPGLVTAYPIAFRTRQQAEEKIAELVRLGAHEDAFHVTDSAQVG